MTPHGMSRLGTSMRWNAMAGDRSFVQTEDSILKVVWCGRGERENDHVGQVTVECWKVVGRQVAPVVLSGCDEMVGGGGVGRG